MISLRKNNKKIMAVLGVFLMIAFGWPTFRGKNASRSGSELIGHIGGEKNYNDEYQNARAEWEVLNKELRVPRRLDRGFGQQQPQLELISLAEAGLFDRLAQATPQPMAAMIGARQIVSQIDPTTYMLLLREAKKL